MRERNESFRREELELLSSAELNQMVRSELEKDSIDRDAVLQILRILEERDAKDPTLQKVDDTAAWEEFQTYFVETEEGCPERSHAHTREKTIPWFAKTVVAAIIVFALLVVAPPAMGYENIFELIGRWTQDVFELFNPNSSTDPQGDYVFETDHPGLQQLYDAVSELGVTQPVVPTWLPEGYDLKELKITQVPAGMKVNALFAKQSEKIVFVLTPRGEDLAYKYEKNDSNVVECKISGITHYVMENEKNWLAVWTAGDDELSITTNSSAEVLYITLESIYMEVEE